MFTYLSLVNQYCDGLRGAFVVYDPNDPHRHLYDIDNGKESFHVGRGKMIYIL